MIGVIDGNAPLIRQLGLMLDTMAFELPPPDGAELRLEMRHLAERVENELVREGNGRYDIKRGPGSSDGAAPRPSSRTDP